MRFYRGGAGKAVLLLFLTIIIARPSIAEEVVAREQGIILLGGRRIGVLTQTIFQEGPDRFRTELRQRMRLRRLGQEFSMIQSERWEEGEGFLSLDAEMSQNGGVERIHAETGSEGGIRVELSRDGAAKQWMVPAGRDLLGPYKAGLLVRRAVESKRSRISYRFFSPQTMEVEEVTLEILGEGKLEDSRGRSHTGILARETSSSIPGFATEMVLSSLGEPLYTISRPGLALEVLKVWGSEAEEEPELLEASSLSLKVRGLPARMEKLAWADFRFTGPGLPALKEALLQSASEPNNGLTRILSGEEGLTVRLRRPPSPAPDGAPNGAPTEGTELPAEAARYLGDGFYLDLGDPRLEALLGTCPESGKGADRLLCLEDLTFRTIRFKSGRIGFIGTSDILSLSEGDCTEHAMLLASLLRKAGFPARLGYGFLLTEQGFVGHAWTEVFFSGRWFWLDPSSPEGQRRRLKLELGTLDPAEPVWGKMGLFLSAALGGLTAEYRGGGDD